jgi:hypothetical protein
MAHKTGLLDRRWETLVEWASDVCWPKRNQDSLVTRNTLLDRRYRWLSKSAPFADRNETKTVSLQAQGFVTLRYSTCALLDRRMRS